VISIFLVSSKHQSFYVVLSMYLYYCAINYQCQGRPEADVFRSVSGPPRFLGPL